MHMGVFVVRAKFFSFVPFVTVVLGASGIAPAVSAEKSWLRPGSVQTPIDNRSTSARIQLGKSLFFDPRLSGSNAISCASCHNPALGWSDSQPTAVGHNMQILGRATPTLINAAFNKLQMWDGRFRSLEEQALGPIVAAGEMNQPLEEVVAELAAIPGYVTMFENAYPGEGITPKTIAKAIAAYERTILSTESPFDRWQKGDEHAVDASVKRGFELFKGKARCDLCHSGFNFTDDGFHNIGLKGNTDEGRFKKVPVRGMRGAFKTPTLRDIALTAPYMHDGRYATLEEVIDHYDRGGDETESLDSQMQALHLTPEEKASLVDFMRSLSGAPRQVVVPTLPSRVAKTPRVEVAVLADPVKRPVPSAPSAALGKPVVAEIPPMATATTTQAKAEPAVVRQVEEVDANAEKLDVYQVDKAFFQGNRRIVAIKVRAGEAVRFQNKDKLSHNLYSLSSAKTFDLGTLKKNETRAVMFDQRGEVEIQCAIHPEMMLVVDVK